MWYLYQNVNNKKKKWKRNKKNHDRNFQKIQDLRMRKKQLVDATFQWYTIACVDLCDVGICDGSFGCKNFLIGSLWWSKMEKQWLCNTKCKKNKNHIFICALFFNVIFCSCHIKMRCFSCCIVSWRLVAFFVSKKVLEFVRKVVKSTFASGDESTSSFAMFPSRHA